MAEEQADRIRIGYVLPPKKQLTLITPSLVSHAAARGIDLVPLDPSLPLSSQARFHALLHKLSSPQWTSQLQDFASKNPAIPIIDPPDNIQRLTSRFTMLQPVSELIVSQETPTFGIPRQIFIRDPEEFSDAGVLKSLSFPVIAKPVAADGSAGAHAMSLVFRRDGLKALQPPVVLQEFVNHGGVVFKAYVVGDYMKCVKRKSIPDVTEEMLEGLECSVAFSQVSNAPVMDGVQKAEMPPSGFIQEIARGLRRAMGLNLFNFDVIRDSKRENHYLIIDINYFPGYAKMPDYERVLTDFFLDIGRKNWGQYGTDSWEGGFDKK